MKLHFVFEVTGNGYVHKASDDDLEVLGPLYCKTFCLLWSRQSNKLFTCAIENLGYY